VPYNYRTIAGTSLNLTDDHTATVTPPFPLQFGGMSFPSVIVGDNGVLSFSDPITNWFNPFLPTSSAQTVVAPFWDDLYLNGGAQNVYWSVTGTAPNRELVIEYRNVPVYACPFGGTVRFEVVFFEGKDDILFNYDDAVVGGSCSGWDYGASATIGVQVTPALSTQFEYNTGLVSNQLALLWTTGGAPTDPVLNFGPASLDFGSVNVGSVADRTFVVQNLGGGTLTGTVTTSAPFSVVSGGAFNLTALATQQVVLRFTPTTTGGASRAIGVASNGGSGSATATGVGTQFGLVINSGPDFGTYPIGIDEIPLSASGGNGVYAWSISDGALPPGINLRTDVTSGVGGAGLSGVATTPGNYA